MFIGAIGVFIGLVSSQFGVDGNVGMFIGLILIICSFLWHVLFVRCPHCGFHFHVRLPITEHCPNCGEKIH